MIVSDAELTPYGKMMMGGNDECEFCGRSLISRFGGLVVTNECLSCAAEFNLLNRAGKLVLSA